MKQLLIIDGYSLAFRAYYAYPPTLTLDDGFCINAIYGFLTMLFSAIDQFKPTHLMICFDRKEPTFRHEAYSEYKAHRPPAPEEFIQQMDRLKKALGEFGVVCVEKAGFEADDLMGTFAKSYVSDCEKVFIFTGDHDTFQLVEDKVNVIMPKKGVSEFMIYDAAAVMDRYNVTPDQIIDFKALKGDTSDNIPGVKGIGDKTAAKLINEYNTLDNIYQKLDSISNVKLKEKLINDQSNAFISYELAKIDINVPIEQSIDDFFLSMEWDVIKTFFEEYKFNSLLKKYDANFSSDVKPNVSSENVNAHYELIQSVEECKLLVDKLKNGFAIDLETTSLTVQDAQIVGIAISYKVGSAVYIPLNEYLVTINSDETIPMFNTGKSTSVKRKLNPILSLLKPIFEDSSVEKYLHNAKYDYQVLYYYGIELNGIVFDTMLASFLCSPFDKIGLKHCALRVFNIEMKSYEEVVGKGKNQLSFEEISIDDALDYAAADADITLRLKNYFEPIIKEKGMDSLFYKIEVPLIIVLAQIEMAGVSLDLERLNSIRQLFSKELEGLIDSIFQKVGHDFNINSTKQVAEVLFDELGLTVIKKTKTGRSTDMSVLEQLKNDHIVIQDIIDYRMLEKLLSTYVNSLPQLISPKTQKIHSHFNQAVAVTGRLSSTAPNLQNIPIRTNKGKEIRSVFVPSSQNHIIMAADYSQIELRLMAHLAKDKAMIEAFHAGVDIHTLTASMVFDCPVEAVTKDQRYKAKAVNFGILYGMSATSLAKQIDVSRKEASSMINDYFLRFPDVQLFIDKTIEQAKKDGYVKTEFGRIRPLPNINTASWSIRQFEERAAVNTRLQGTAADIMKLAMINVFKTLNDSKLNSKMIIQVHDELVFDVEEPELSQLTALVLAEMEGVVDYLVPLTVDVQIGKNWLELN